MSKENALRVASPLDVTDLETDKQITNENALRVTSPRGVFGYFAVWWASA